MVGLDVIFFSIVYLLVPKEQYQYFFIGGTEFFWTETPEALQEQTTRYFLFDPQYFWIQSWPTLDNWAGQIWPACPQLMITAVDCHLLLFNAFECANQS